MEDYARPSDGPPRPAGTGTTARLWASLQGRRGRLFLETSAAGGELLVARVRIGVLLVASMVLAAPGWSRGERWTGLALAAGGLAYAVGALVAARRSMASLGGITSAVDATLVSAALLAVAQAGHRHSAAAWTVFDLHLLLILLAGLRFDWRLPLGMGVLAAAEYLLLSAVTWPTPGAGPESLVDFARLVLLLAASLLSSALVVRGSRLRELSTRDPLTGLWNRGAFEARLGEEVRRAHRHRRALALAVVDVDKFKQLNDTHGHAAGDAALREIAHRCRHLIRDTDFAARIGGEEFAILLPETESAAAAAKLDQILDRVAGAPIAMRWGSSLRVTVSAGVAALRPGMTAAALLRAADDCLYKAKRGGRDRVVAAGHSDLVLAGLTMEQSARGPHARPQGIQARRPAKEGSL